MLRIGQNVTKALLRDMSTDEAASVVASLRTISLNVAAL